MSVPVLEVDDFRIVGGKGYVDISLDVDGIYKSHINSVPEDIPIDFNIRLMKDGKRVVSDFAESKLSVMDYKGAVILDKVFKGTKFSIPSFKELASLYKGEKSFYKEDVLKSVFLRFTYFIILDDCRYAREFSIVLSSLVE